MALADVLPVKLKAQKDTAAKREEAARRKARALAKEHNIDIETYRDSGYTSIIVWGPKGVDLDNDPFEGDHYADDWQDALERVEEYIKVREAA